MIGTLWVAMLIACVEAQYGPDPKDVPGDFMCAWRELAASYAKVIRPDAEALVHDALELSTYCNSSRPAEADVPPLFPPTLATSATSIYVDAKAGKDSNPGTISAPKRSLQAGVAAARGKAGPTVVLRAGTFFLDSSVTITSEDSGLTIQNYNGEEVWVSGGTLLEDLAWEKHAVGSKSNIWKADVSKYSLPEILALRVNGRRVSPGRYPNADPETQFWPIGYLASNRADWLPSTIPPVPNPAKPVLIASPNRTWDDIFDQYSGGIGGTCSIYDPPFSYWCSSKFSPGCGGCFTWHIPSGLKIQNKLPNAKNYTNWEDAHMVAWREAHWANWRFEVKSFDASKDEVHFGKGGFQGARGGPGSDWYISNVLEEIDAPTEFYFHKKEQALYYWANNTHQEPPSADTQFVACQLHTLINASGSSMGNPIKHLSIKGIGFRDTAPTMLQPHAVPSGGDWALERIGAVFLERTEDTVIDTISMWRIGGNGIMVSKYNQRTVVQQSSFAWMGGSAIALWGWTDEISDGGIHGIDGTGGDFPRYTKIQYNLFHEIGVWEKQSSAVFEAKSAQTDLYRNLVFNLARAGFNFNDGFGGGDNVVENVLFNTCRESSDHGPINSWDRQPFLTNVRTGFPSTQMSWRNVTKNIVIANYGGSKEVDNDDGSLFYRVHSNFMVYGWGQKFKCGAIESFDNVKAFIDLGGKFDAGCLTGPMVHYPNLWHNDVMVHLGAANFDYRQCWSKDGHDWDKTQVYNNTIYVRDAKAQVDVTGCPKTITLEQLQKRGGDPGTVLHHAYPPTSAIVTWAKTALGSWSS